MILLHCIGNVTDASADMTAIIMKAVPALIYLGSSKVIKKGLSPIGRIDIQNRALGKGAGYERWAKGFNLKQTAKTLLFL